MSRGLLTFAVVSAVASDAQAISCTFVSVVGVSFGAYDIFVTSPTDSTGSVTLNCTGVLGTDQIVIDLSRGASSTYTPRTLSNGTSNLEYNLYLDAARTTVWGDATNTTSHHGPVNPPNGSDFSVTVYGRIPAQQTTVTTGSYSDTITATIVF